MKYLQAVVDCYHLEPVPVVVGYQWAPLIPRPDLQRQRTAQDAVGSHLVQTLRRCMKTALLHVLEVLVYYLRRNISDSPFCQQDCWVSAWWQVVVVQTEWL